MEVCCLQVWYGTIIHIYWCVVWMPLPVQDLKNNVQLDSPAHMVLYHMGTCSHEHQKHHVDLFFGRLLSIDDLKKCHVNIIKIFMEFPGWNLFFNQRNYQFEATKNVHIKSVAHDFPSGFLVFEGCAYICGFLITSGMPYKLGSQW